MANSFLLTYSVIAKYGTPTDGDKADKVRHDIAKVRGWIKSHTNETTFTGIMSIKGKNNEERQKSAINNIKNEFKPILKKHEASRSSVTIYCTLMVSCVDKPFQFEVYY
ncbi:MAG TPA: hypothetical protein DEV59_11930 [Proteus sp.]|uniref:Uncharacterized protein n=1 Tax=Proteus hauseri ATCC 700826 TaxID=1354271 RepID=A0AAJ3HRL2_PROHU|nr:hypothetical protein [Proteus hauseri]OAT46346.1 hypothetical protein M997_2219 [Proteus hauseri ATCC 700826]HCH51375.1 hypothetical protein [Proteus sp. (in: enterobacteria)]